MTKRTCSVVDCGGDVWAKGVCNKHYQRLRFHGTTDDPVRVARTRNTIKVVKVCSVSGCVGKSQSLGFCVKHYSRLKRHGTTADPVKTVKLCAVDGCDREARSLGYCIKHYTRLRNHGDPLKFVHRPPHTGCTRKDGYVVIQRDNVTKLAHVLVAEKVLGKPLPPGAVVHHVDGNPSNNAPSNLVICPSQAYHVLIHRRQTALENCGNANFKKCRYCKQYDAPENMKTSDRFDYYAEHRSCSNEDARARRQRKNQQPTQETT